MSASDFGHLVYLMKVSDSFSIARRLRERGPGCPLPTFLRAFGIDGQLASQPKAAWNVANVTSFPAGMGLTPRQASSRGGPETGTGGFNGICVEPQFIQCSLRPGVFREPRDRHDPICLK
jgi:hypothetical protein